MSAGYRVMATTRTNIASGGREVWWEVHSVNLNGVGQVNGFSKHVAEADGRTLEDLRRELTRMLMATYEPKLMAKDVERGSP